jgi:D-glycero-alpha-D-manno-heptose 1-phosphate guanylyltransferase
MALSYRSDNIIDWYEKQSAEYSFSIKYSIEQDSLGTGGGLRQALELTLGMSVLVMNGDSFVDFEYRKLFDFHKENSAELTMALKFIEDVSRNGAVEINETNKQVICFREKVCFIDEGYINAGLYLFDKSALLKLKPKTKLSLEYDLLPACIGEHCFAYVSDGDFIDIGTPETYGVVD